MLFNEPHVVRLQLLPIRWFRQFRVQVIFIKLLYPGQHFTIMVITKIVLLSFAMPGVKRMVANHAKPSFGQMILENMVTIFVVPPGKEHVPQATPSLIHT